MPNKHNLKGLAVRLHGLDLFSGIAGNSLGLRNYIKTIAYCESDRHAQSVLLSRMGDGSLECAPIWDDVTTLTASLFDVPIDIIIAGFPCQDISVAGCGEGLEGKRSGLFFEVMRLAKEIKPTFLFLENVPAIRTRGLDRVVEELTEAGYDCRWCMLSASEVGAPHKRERWFCLAYLANRDSEFLQGLRPSGIQKLLASTEARLFRCDGQIKGSISNAYQRGLSLQRPEFETAGLARENQTRKPKWPIEPNVGRVVNGLPLRVERIKRLGNAVVPQQAKEAFCRLLGCQIGEDAAFMPGFDLVS